MTREGKETGVLNGNVTYAPVEGSERYWCKEHFPRTIIDIRREEDCLKWVPCAVLDGDKKEIAGEQIVRVKIENGEVLCFELKDGRPFEDPENHDELKMITKFFKPPLRLVKL